LIRGRLFPLEADDDGPLPFDVEWIRRGSGLG
jgi:hypothetical protein